MFGALWEFLTDNKKDRANIHLMLDNLEKAILDLQAKQVFTVHHDKFSLAPHAWTEPDSVAHDIAGRNSIRLLDQPIGTGTKDPDPQEPQEPHQQPVHWKEMSFLA